MSQIQTVSKNISTAILPRKAVVVGAGFIGLEMAENLHAQGAKVSIVEMGNQVMAPIDFSMASLVHQHLMDKGVNLYLEQAVASFEREGKGLKVTFKNGQSISADIVILSIGVRPETSLARAAELTIGPAGGIAVNDYLQTSDEAIYAIGDAIEYRHSNHRKAPGSTTLQALPTAKDASLQTIYWELKFHTKVPSALPSPKSLI